MLTKDKINAFDWSSLESGEVEVAKGVSALWEQPKCAPFEPAQVQPYEEQEGLRNSEMNILLKGHEYWEAYLKGELDKGSTDALITGQVAHQLVLEPHKSLEDCRLAVTDKDWNGRLKENRDWKAKQEDRGFTVWKYDKMEEVEAYAEAARGNKDLQKLLKGAVMEKELYWDFLEYGTKAKAKIDALVPGKHLVDLKFIREPTSHWQLMTKLIRDYHYDRQMAYYLTGAIANGLLTEESKVYLACIIKDKPYPVKIFEMEAKTLLRGQTKYLNLLKFYDQWKNNRLLKVKYYKL